MKLKYFIPSLVAVVAAIFTGCSSDNDPSYLDGLRVSQSYVALPQNGGSTSITINSADSWNIDEASIPAWLNISPKSGSAGEGTVSFSVESTEDARSCELLLKSAGKTQRINVLQYAEETEPVIMSVSEALAMINAGTMGTKAHYVKGIVCKIQEISPSYGNATYYLSDDGTFKNGTWLQVYRGYWLNNEKFTDANAFSVGDELIIKGVLINYNGNTPETQQGACEVISVSKSLLKCDSLMVADEKISELPAAGGEITAYLTCKTTNGVAVEIPAEAKEWLGVTSSTVGAIPTVTFYAKKNEGGDREATVIFKTTDGSKDYTAQATITQKGSIVDSNVASFLAAPVNTTNYRITGVVTELYTSDKNGDSFYIQDYSGKVLVYRASGFKNSGAKVGDVVTVVGQRGAYKDTPQMVSGTFEEVKYSVTEVTIAEFLTKADDKNTYYKVTGTISSLKGSNGKDNDYGNLYITDGTNELYVYGCYPGYGATGDARKFFIADNNIKVGDELTMIGYKDTYNGLVELCGGICFGFKHAE